MPVDEQLQRDRIQRAMLLYLQDGPKPEADVKTVGMLAASYPDWTPEEVVAYARRV